MPLFNTSPIDSTPEEYAAYVERGSNHAVSCFVTSNTWDKMDYSSETKSIKEDVIKNADRVEQIVSSMIVTGT